MRYRIEDITNEEELIKKVVGILVKNRLTISTAESCTGGMVAEKLISFPGISEVYLEGAITYSNEAKVKRLGVKDSTLMKYGAVSEEIAREMAIGMARKSESQVSIAITGLAGPGGGTLEKPIGLVYIGIYLDGEVIVKKFNFLGTRNNIRFMSTINSLSLLEKELIRRGYK